MTHTGSAQKGSRAATTSRVDTVTRGRFRCQAQAFGRTETNPESSEGAGADRHRHGIEFSGRLSSCLQELVDLDEQSLRMVQTHIEKSLSLDVIVAEQGGAAG